MLVSLDPHSAYLTPELYKELQVETKGSFGGLGIEITKVFRHQLANFLLVLGGLQALAPLKEAMHGV